MYIELGVGEVGFFICDAFEQVTNQERNRNGSSQVNFFLKENIDRIFKIKNKLCIIIIFLMCYNCQQWSIRKTE